MGYFMAKTILFVYMVCLMFLRLYFAAEAVIQSPCHHFIRYLDLTYLAQRAKITHQGIGKAGQTT